MPRFKTVHRGLKLLPIDFDKQLLPGTFEHALCYLVDHELDLADFHSRYRNSTEGAPAYDPAVLLKIVLLAYSRGIISSRQMEAACRDHVLFMAISGDSQPHFTTLAHFVSSMGDLAAKLFAVTVLAACHLLAGWALHREEHGEPLPSSPHLGLSAATASAMLGTLWLVLAKPV